MRRQLYPKISNLYAYSPLIISFSHNTHVDVGDLQIQTFFPFSNFTFSVTCWVFLSRESQTHSVQIDCIFFHWNPAPPLVLSFSVYAIRSFLLLLNGKSQIHLCLLFFTSSSQQKSVYFQLPSCQALHSYPYRARCLFLLPNSLCYFHTKSLLSLAKITVSATPYETSHRGGFSRRLVKLRSQGPALT